MSDRSQVNKKIGAVMVAGGGVCGMQAALDLAEGGFKVYLTEELSAIGGRMVQLDKTFPTNECSMCVVSPKLVECARHLNIEIITLSDIESIDGRPGNYTVTLNKRPRYIDEKKCNGCGECIIYCPVRNRIDESLFEKRTKVILPAHLKEELDAILSEHKDKEGVLMLILQAVNARYNYFSEDVLRYIAQELNINEGVILRIATFYNSFSLTPKGRHTISVCMGTTCYVRGSDKIIQNLSRELDVAQEGTTKDGRFNLKSVRCLGCCSIAPALMVDTKVYGRVKIRELKSILKDYK